jgi:hypothetical protein
MKFEVEIEEGDVIISNNQEWKVEEVHAMWGIDLVQSGTGEYRNFDREEVQEMIDFSGQFKLIKEDYIGL